VTPEQFQRDTLAWLTAIGAVLPAFSAVAIGIIGVLAGIWAAYKSRIQQVQIDSNASRLDKTEDKVSTLMLATPPPGTPTMPQTTINNQPGATVTENAAPADAPADATTPNPPSIIQP
jgi:hypothetical protein